jgi:outer membrane protein
MRISKKIVPGIFLIIGSFGLKAQTDSVYSFTLSQAREFAIKNNLNAKNAQLDIESARKKVWETTAIGLPQFNVTAKYQHIFDSKPFPFSGGIDTTKFRSLGIDDAITKDDLLKSFSPPTYIQLLPPNNTTFDFTLSQLIFSGEYIVGLQASRVYKELSERSLEKTEDQIKESVSNSYYTVLVLDENIRILKQSLDAVAKTTGEMEAMYKQGFVEETDVDQLKINKSNLATTIRTMEGQKGVSEKLLKLQLGIAFSSKVLLTDSIGSILEGVNFQLITSSDFDVTGNIDYQLIQTQEDLAKLSLRREKSKFLPTISGFYQHEEQTNQPGLNFMPKDVIGVSMNFPIFSSGQRMMVVGEAKIDYDKAVNAKTLAEQNLEMEFEQAKNDYITSYNNYTTNKDNLDLSKKIYNKTLIKYKEGMATSIELTQQQNQFLGTEGNYFNSILSLLNAKAKLERILTKYNSNE